MNPISILYSPAIDKEEMEIIADAFHQNVSFSKVEKKGIVGGAFDIEIVINIVSGIISAGLYDLIKKLFTRNRGKIMDRNSKPRYTILVLRMESKWVIMSNVNDKNELRIRKASANIEDKYSNEKLSEYMKD